MPKGRLIASVNYDHTGGPGVYELDPEHSYAKVESTSPLPLDPWDSPNYTYASGRPLGLVWLYAIKTQHVGTGQVEVHVIDRDPKAHDNKYRTFIRQEPSAIDVTDAKNYDFLVGDFGDLICVKRRNTASGLVEVRVLIWDKFQYFSVEEATSIPLSRADNFDFAVTYENRLVAIERAGTDEQKVVLHFLSEDYRTVTRRVVTSMDLATARELTFGFEAFVLGGLPEIFMNLVGFTRGITKSGNIEIVKLAQPWTGVPDVFPTVIKNSLAPNFQFVILYAPARP